MLEDGADLNLDSPAVSSQELTTQEQSLLREIVGSLNWVSVASRADICYHVSVLAQHIANPQTTHLKAARRVVRYLVGTKHMGLSLGGRDQTISVYHDTSFASQPGRKSVSGFVLFIGESPAIWGSKKQELVTLSTGEAEYVGLTPAAKNILWMHKLVVDLQEWLRLPGIYPHSPTVLFTDSENAEAIARDSVFHERTKHISIKYHFIRQTMEDGHITLQAKFTEEMIADILTKSLGPSSFKYFRDCLNIG